jgi:hypothetical protein
MICRLLSTPYNNTDVCIMTWALFQTKCLMHVHSEVHVKSSKHTPLARAPVGQVCIVSIAHACATRSQSGPTLWVSHQGCVCHHSCASGAVTTSPNTASAAPAAWQPVKKQLHSNNTCHVCVLSPGRLGCTARIADPASDLAVSGQISCARAGSSC